MATSPGDLIGFDERLQHRSQGGRGRLQWRADVVAQPSNDQERDLVRTYFAQIFSGTWRQDYDALRYPSYGSAFREAASAYREGLQDLDVFSMAARFEGRDLLP